MAKTDPPGPGSDKTLKLEGSFSSLLNAVTESAFLMTPEGLVIAANRTVADRFGFKSADDLTGKNIYELLPPEVALSRKALADEVVLTGKPARFEDERSGVHILNSVYPVFEPSGKVDRLAVFGMDITGRKEAERSLLESEERFKALHNASFGGIAIHDNGIILDCNKGLSEMTGFNLDELTGMDGLLLIAEKSREMVRKNISSGHEKPYEAFGLRKNGEEYPMRLEARNVPYRGKMVRTVEFRDITEQREAERLLKASERKYRTLAENMKDVIWTMDPETMMFTYVSPSVTGLRGYTPEEVMSEPMDAAFTAETRKAMRNLVKKGREEFLAGRISTEMFFTEEIEQPCRDGSTVWTEAVTRYMRNLDTGRVEIHGVTRDITARRKAEQEYQTLFREMLDAFALHEIIFDKDGNPSDYRFLAVNPAFERMTGLEGGEIIGKTVLEVLPRTESSWIEAYGKVALTGEPAFFEGFAREMGQYFLVRAFRPEPGRFACIFSDITEKKRQEEKLKLSEERLDLAMQVANDGMWDWDIANDRIYFDPRYYTMAGYSPDEYPHDFNEWVKRVHPDDIERCMKTIRTFLSGDESPFDLEFRFRRKDETWMWIRGRGKIVERDAKGKASRMVGTHSDITSRRKAEDDLAGNYLLLRIAGKTARFGGWVVDLGSNMCMWSDAVSDIHEMPRDYSPPVEEGIGFYHPDWLPLIKKVFSECADKGVPYDEEMEIVTRSGKRVWVRTIGEAVRDASGKIVKVQGSFQDISQGKKAEQALRDSEHRFRMLSEVTMEGIIIQDRGVVVDINPSVSRMTGYGRDELIGKNLIELAVHEEDRDIIGENIAKEYAPPYIARIVRKNGDLFYAEIEARDIEIDGKKLRVASIRDITDRKKAEDSLMDTLERLRRVTGSVIQVIVMAVESRDPYTAGHQRRVGDLARSIASEMGVSPRDADGIRIAGMIHDLGKISVPSEILSKPRELNETEFALIREHPRKGHEILKGVDFDWPVADMVLQHHERLDGSGYPLGLKGDEITLGARIIAVADVVEAMASHRPYRPTKGIDAALDEIVAGRGVLYDPEAVDACLALFTRKQYCLPDA